jgi:GT2 family glycosyltransferase
VKLAALILNWRNPSSTCSCADSVLGANGRGVDAVYIVDNASRDGSTQILRDRYSTCQILENDQNSGYTGGNNFGLSRIFGDGFDAALILNNDVTLEVTREFRSLSAALLKTNPCCLIGLSVIDINTMKTAYPARPGITLRIALRRLLGTHSGNELPILCGCAVIVSREAFLEKGGLDESFFMYGEELEYSIRIYNSGGLVTMLPKTAARVYRDQSPSTRSPYVYYYQTRNFLYLLSKHDVSKSSLLKAGVAFMLIAVAARSGKASHIKTSLLGVYDAIRHISGCKTSLHSR